MRSSAAISRKVGFTETLPHSVKLTHHRKLGVLGLFDFNRLLWVIDRWRSGMSVGRGVRVVVTDSHFLVPFVVLLAGIALLVALH
jgi:hypothetical protein